MTLLNKPARTAVSRGHKAATVAGHIVKDAVTAAAKAGASAAVIAGTIEMKKGMREATTASRRGKRMKVAAVVAGVTAATAAGFVLGRKKRA